MAKFHGRVAKSPERQWHEKEGWSDRVSVLFVYICVSWGSVAVTLLNWSNGLRVDFVRLCLIAWTWCEAELLEMDLFFFSCRNLFFIFITKNVQVQRSELHAF